MVITKEQVLGQIVSEDYRAAAVFKDFGIDFCCNGNRSIEEACNQANINCDKVLGSLNAALQERSKGAIDYASWPLDLLADYIEKNHHRYVRKKIEEITPYLNKIMKVHGDRHPELLTIQELFTESASDLTSHMYKEEQVLFPYIRSLVEQGEAVNKPHFGTVKNPISMMHHEHNIEGERFRKIAQLSNQYTPPVDACGTYKVTFALLKEFEEDLHLHIHLENNILFPAAIALEANLKPNN